MTKAQAVEEIAFRGTRGPRIHPAFTLLGGILIGASAAGVLGAVSAHPGATSGIHSPQADLKVQYMIQESPTSASGSTLEEVTDIEFLPSYIVVRQGDESGRVFFPERTQRLSWHR